MMTLKDAVTLAGNNADLVNVGSWPQTFIASLEASGFVIVPKEATGEMSLLGMKSIADALDDGDMLTPGEVFTKMLAARPKIGDEG